MNKMVVLVILAGFGIACNTSKHHSSDRKKNHIDSLPPTIIQPAIKTNPTVSPDSSSMHYPFQSSETERDLFSEVSESLLKQSL